MKKIRNIFTIVLFIAAIGVQAQEFGSNAIGSPALEESATESKNGFKPDVSVSLGSSFTSFAPGYNAFGTYVMPEICFPVSNKFSISVGVGYSTMFYDTPSSTGNIFSNEMSQYGHVHVSGLYHINEKLSIAGTAYKTFDLAPKQPEANPRAIDYSNEGIMFNVDYKVNDHLRINAGFSYQKRNSYNMYDPLGAGMFNPHRSPFDDPVFGNGF